MSHNAKVIQCLPLNRITISRLVSDNNNRMIQFTDMFCVLFGNRNVLVHHISSFSNKKQKKRNFFSEGRLFFHKSFLDASSWLKYHFWYQSFLSTSIIRTQVFPILFLLQFHYLQYTFSEMCCCNFTVFKLVQPCKGS